MRKMPAIAKQRAEKKKEKRIARKLPQLAESVRLATSSGKIWQNRSNGYDQKVGVRVPRRTTFSFIFI